MTEVGVYEAPGRQGGFLTPLLLLVVTVFGAHSGGGMNPVDVADVAFDGMNSRIHEVRTVRTIEYAAVPPAAVAAEEYRAP